MTVSRTVQVIRGLQGIGLSAVLAGGAAAQPPDYLFQQAPTAEQPAAETPTTETPAAPVTSPTVETPAATDAADATAEAAAPAEGPQINDDALEAFQRANILVNQGDFAGALAATDEAISLQPDYFDAFLFRNLVYRLTGNFVEAIRAVDQAIAIDPVAANGYLNRALTYVETKDFDKALADVDEVLKTTPNNAQAFVVAGQIHAKQEHWQQMADAYSKAIDYAATAPGTIGDSLMQRGIALFHLGEYDVAKLDFEQAAIFGGGLGGEANRWRGYIYAIQGDYYRAIRWYDRAIKANPGNAQAFRNRGMAYLNLAASEPQIEHFALTEALASFNAAIRQLPNDAQLYYRRGVAYDRLGASDSARSSYQTAVRLDPKLTAAADKLSSHESTEYWYDE
ncbi:MAG: tetratricopeptide repeat protein [Planctomycetia bacterium]|nr:tetratricopeptide repeat protein [Planctomycetia bacterium]